MAGSHEIVDVTQVGSATYSTPVAESHTIIVFVMITPCRRDRRTDDL
ncbi:MAG TPA: hypothetical protein VF172_00400 [Nitrososphaera sp.]